MVSCCASARVLFGNLPGLFPKKKCKKLTQIKAINGKTRLNKPKHGIFDEKEAANGPCPLVPLTSARRGRLACRQNPLP
jgi:hypothetical protein